MVYKGHYTFKKSFDLNWNGYTKRLNLTSRDVEVVNGKLYYLAETDDLVCLKIKGKPSGNSKVYEIKEAIIKNSIRMIGSDGLSLCMVSNEGIVSVLNDDRNIDLKEEFGVH